MHTLCRSAFVNHREGLVHNGRAIATDTVKSPLTGYVAPYSHERFYTVPLNKFCFPSSTEVLGVNPIIEDPLDVSSQQFMKRYLAYESVRGLRGSSIAGKVVGVNHAHEELGLLPPFSTSLLARKHLKELKDQDDPPKFRVPVDPSVSEYYALTHGMSDPSVVDVFEAQCTGRSWCMRSSEYLAKDSSKPRADALKWKDVYFREADGKILQGLEVSHCARRVTCSISSNKNPYGRCTRTKEIAEEDALDGGRALRERYIRYLCSNQVEPDPEAFVFAKTKGTGFVTRSEVSKSIQDILEKFGVPRDMAGSHSLRRGGATQMRAAGVPDEDIKRWGRWTSDAYKLYVHVAMDNLDGWGEKIASVRPIYELN